MATLVGKAHIESLAGGALGIASITGYISPNLKTLRLVHNAEVQRLKGQDGKTSGLIGNDEVLECSFDFIPEGSTIANAKKSAALPKVLSGVTITGLPIVQMGEFADALNTNGDNAQPWIYEGGGTINGESEGAWTATLVLRRYPGITSAAAITA